MVEDFSTSERNRPLGLPQSLIFLIKNEGHNERYHNRNYKTCNSCVKIFKYIFTNIRSNRQDTRGTTRKISRT